MNNNLGNKKTMANNLKYYMNKNNVSRNQLSSSLGIAYTTLADWLNAKTYPRIDKIEMLANYFGIENKVNKIRYFCDVCYYFVTN